MNFNDTAIAFQGKSNRTLYQSYLLFRLIGLPRLTNVLSVLLTLTLPFWFPIPFIKATIFRHFCGGESLAECDKTIALLGEHNVKTILDYSVEGKEEEKVFDENLDQMLLAIEKSKNNKDIPFAVFKISGFGRLEILQKVSEKQKLNPTETEEYQRIEQRIDVLCASASKVSLPIFIDAEESWVQYAIDRITLEMMKKYNTKRTIVFCTLQLYRWDRLSVLEEWHQEAQAGNFYFGAKLVRGAYIEKERERAQKKGYKDPIQRTKEDTDRDFNLAITYCIKHLDKISLCCATHNEESVLHMMEEMKKYKIAVNDERIYTAQLLGMSDHISMNAAKENYNVAKYVPYGPIKDVMPYLIRRAKENTSIAGQTSRELTLLAKERLRRKNGK